MMMMTPAAAADKQSITAVEAEADRLRVKNAELVHMQSQFSTRNLDLHSQNDELQVGEVRGRRGSQCEKESRGR
jgi:hypothetical protein